MLCPGLRILSRDKGMGRQERGMLLGPTQLLGWLLDAARRVPLLMQAAHTPAPLELSYLAGCLEVSRGHPWWRGPRAWPVPPMCGCVFLHPPPLHQASGMKRDVGSQALRQRAWLPTSVPPAAPCDRGPLLPSGPYDITTKFRGQKSVQAALSVGELPSEAFPGLPPRGCRGRRLSPL